MIKGAELSSCGKYRYQLWRIWDKSKPMVLFVMHNPSTADANADDPTIRRCIEFAKSWGAGGIYVGNLSPYRATDKKDLAGLSPDELMIDKNLQHIDYMAQRCQVHILAHGETNIVCANYIIGKIYRISRTRWSHLKRNKSGNPAHPLYLSKELKPIYYTRSTEVQDGN